MFHCVHSTSTHNLILFSIEDTYISFVMLYRITGNNHNCPETHALVQLSIAAYSIITVHALQAFH